MVLMDATRCIRGASPLGLPDTRSRAPLRGRAPVAWLARNARSHLGTSVRFMKQRLKKIDECPGAAVSPDTIVQWIRSRADAPMAIRFIRSRAMIDGVQRILNRLGQQLPGRVSMPGDAGYIVATDIWAKPIDRVPRA